MQILKQLKDRYSPMQFLPEKKIEKSKLDKIFEAARWAASSYNEQPWYYIWADNNGELPTHGRTDELGFGGHRLT